ncbi:hypothetical protein ACTFIR_001139 [Dictyostelium discoideum]
MKINSISFIILIILFYNVVNSSCPNCLKENDICDSGTCSDDTKCLSNNSSPPRCTKYLRSGDKCSPGVDLCILGTSCVLDKSEVYRCLDYSFRSLGEQCQLQSDCIYQLDCINNVCVNSPTKYTHCHDIDESCNYDEYCYCIASSNCICQKIKTQGSPCNYSRDCLGGLTCNKGICGNPQLIELGGSCWGTYNCDANNDCYYNGFCDYNKGLYCSDNICQEFVQPSPKSCRTNATVSECSAYQTCSCSDHECYQSSIYPPESLKMVASSQLEKCAYDNKCSVNVNLYSSESCLSKHCRKEICQRYVGDFKVKEEDGCGKEELRSDLLFCSSNSSSKITQSLTYLLIKNSVVNGGCQICLKEYDICGGNHEICSYDTTCLNNTYEPSNQNLKCTKYLREGDECGAGYLRDLCIEGTLCLMDRNKVYRCFSNKFATLGEYCELNTDCATDELVCNNNECRLKTSANCNGLNSNCNYDEYCLGNSCVKIKFEGESCIYNSQCFGPMSCKNNVCSNQLVGLGANCKYDLCDYNRDLYCSDDICIEYVEPIMKSCSPNATYSQCPDLQKCSCSDEKCYRYLPIPTERFKASDDLYKCAYDNKCSLDESLYYNTKSCVSKNCKETICSFSDNFGAKESDDCGKNAFFRDRYCNSSFKLTQSITSLFIILFFGFVITF